MITIESNENEENIFTYSDSKVMTNNTYMNSKLMTKYSNENNQSGKNKILYTFISKNEPQEELLKIDQELEKTEQKPAKLIINNSIKKQKIDNYVEKIPCASIANEFTSPGIQSDSYFEHKTSSFFEDEPTDELEFSQKNHAKRIYITSQKR